MLLTNVDGLSFIPQILMAALLAGIAMFFILYFRSQRHAYDAPALLKARKEGSRLVFSRAGRMAPRDLIPMLLITALYALTTFHNLGNTESPTTYHPFTDESPSVTVEFDKPVQLSRLLYFTGLGHGRGDDHKEVEKDCCYKIELSGDGQKWHGQSGCAEQIHANTFRWLEKGIDNYQTCDACGGTGEIDQARCADCEGRGSRELPSKFLRLTSMNTIPDEHGNTGKELEMVELAVYEKKTDDEKALIDPSRMTVTPAGASVLFDEQSTVPERKTVQNGSYFDEIYHAYTAYENIRNIYPYETTHPPLGKLITSIGIRIYGMTPFGWRVLPALFGVLMLPLLYILIKWMFGNLAVAACGTAIFAFDFMHLTQTRISTIDVYGVFFIICMYLCMYWYITTPMDAPFTKSLVPFMLCGLSFGLGASSKWTVIYSAGGIAVLMLIHFFQRNEYYKTVALQAKKRASDAMREARRSRKKQQKADDGKTTVPPLPVVVTPEKTTTFKEYFIRTVIAGVIGFIVIPMIIYISSYIPYATPEPHPYAKDHHVWVTYQNSTGLSKAWALTKLTVTRFKENNKTMFSYHRDLTATHPYSARWYQWIFNTNTTFYFSEGYDSEDGTRIHTGLSCFTNPLIAWAGIVALFFVCFLDWKRGIWMVYSLNAFLFLWILVQQGTYFGIEPGTEHAVAKLGSVKLVGLLLIVVYTVLAYIYSRRKEAGSANSHVALFITVGCLFQLVPWIPITRITFVYHYFPTIVFLCLAICYIFSKFIERAPKLGFWAMIAFTAVSIGLFWMFYPVIAGEPAPRAYMETYLKWLPKWTM
ncbi:MAG: phospholipid carrier-dependent glycosyltransferase [Oscillospiraceae bacterium]|nr:phospholipid carrier-dependent glycosyltransferase [Oscillospiraceae bacterium]